MKRITYEKRLEDITEALKLLVRNGHHYSFRILSDERYRLLNILNRKEEKE